MSLREGPRRLVVAVTSVALAASAISWSPATAQSSPTVGVPAVDPLLDLCASVSLDELEGIAGLRFATATPEPLACTYASEIGAGEAYWLDLRIDAGQVSGLEEFESGGRRLDVAGRPAYWTGTALWTDFADGLLAVQPLVFEPGVDLLALARSVAELALSRIGPPLVDAVGAFTFEELKATPSACYGEAAWADAEGHRISGLPVAIELTARHVRDTSDQAWLIVEDHDFMGTQPTLIGAEWEEAVWSYAYGLHTVLVPGPRTLGKEDFDLQWEVVLRSVLDVAYEVRVTAGPPADPQPEARVLDAIVRAPDLARWERLVSGPFC